MVEHAIKISAADGHLIHALHVKNSARSLVVLSHGITTGKEEDGIYTRFAQEILAPGFDSVRFDYRGHGESKMKPSDVTVCGEILDFMAVVRWSADQGYEKVFHVATSFGASVLLLAVGVFPLPAISGVVMWNPVISYEHTFVGATVPWGKEFFDQRDLAELAARNGTPIPETDFVIGPRMTMELLMLAPEKVEWPSSIPMMAIHGDKDTTVPFDDARDYCLRNPGTEFLAIKGVDHGFDEKIEDVYSATKSWIGEAAKG